MPNGGRDKLRMRPLRKTCQMMAVMGRKQGHAREMMAMNKVV